MSGVLIPSIGAFPRHLVCNSSSGLALVFGVACFSPGDELILCFFLGPGVPDLFVFVEFQEMYIKYCTFQKSWWFVVLWEGKPKEITRRRLRYYYL